MLQHGPVPAVWARGAVGRRVVVEAGGVIPAAAPLTRPCERHSAAREAEATTLRAVSVQAPGLPGGSSPVLDFAPYLLPHR